MGPPTQKTTDCKHTAVTSQEIIDSFPVLATANFPLLNYD